MRKFVITDALGVAANGKRVAVGKITHRIGAPNDIYFHTAALCSDSPLLAALQNPSYTASPGQRLFEIHQWEGLTDTDPPHVYTVVKELPLPEVTPVQKLAFAILALAEVYHEPRYRKWADKWLSGADRGPIPAYEIEQGAVQRVESAETLTDLEAFGYVSEEDRHVTEKKADDARRVGAVARASILFASGDPTAHSEVAKLLVQATVGLSHAGKPLDLCAVAERAVQAVAGLRTSDSL
ncbi:MAG: hypothetical protein HY942_05080 [Gammaproteobacteria bacterium]|nr:hypothetical protein [Gammaproteobacteria bacterium]